MHQCMPETLKRIDSLAEGDSKRAAKDDRRLTQVGFEKKKVTDALADERFALGVHYKSSK